MHTFCVVLGSDELALVMVNGVHKRVCPEMAVLGVESLEVSQIFWIFSTCSAFVAEFILKGLRRCIGTQEAERVRQMIDHYRDQERVHHPLGMHT